MSSATGKPCDSTVVTYSSIAEYLGVPHFALDIPTWKDERAIQYVADEVGIPTLIVGADFCDARVFSDEGIRVQLSDFFNTMLV